jgi:deoxyribonuclease-4
VGDNEIIRFGPAGNSDGDMLVALDLRPVIICESRGTMAEDAVRLKGIFSKKLSIQQ